MTPSPTVALTILAEAAYLRSDPETWREKWPPAMLGVITNPDRSQLMGLAVGDCQHELNRVLLVLSASPELSIFLPQAGAFDPTLIYPGGSIRQPFSQFVVSLFESAAQRFYFLRQEMTLTSFTEAVLENYKDFLRQGLGEAIRAYDLIGFTGIQLPVDQQVSTPWGVLRTAPPNFRVGLDFNRTTAILVTSRSAMLKVSREEYPAQLLTGNLDTPNVEAARQLLPMAFALASRQNPRCTPMVTFTATLYPLMPLNNYHHPGILFPIQPTPRPTKDEMQDTERWAQLLENSRGGSLGIAEKRLVSAIAQRSDKTDALIDAVIAWENFVGTKADRVTERVTNALTNLVENDLAGRPALQERLKWIYDVRSRVVHGDIGEGEEVSIASAEAIDIGLRSLRRLHELSGDWLTIKSKAREKRLRNF